MTSPLVLRPSSTAPVRRRKKPSGPTAAPPAKPALPSSRGSPTRSRPAPMPSPRSAPRKPACPPPACRASAAAPPASCASSRPTSAPVTISTAVTTRHCPTASRCRALNSTWFSARSARWPCSAPRTSPSPSRPPGATPPPRWPQAAPSWSRATARTPAPARSWPRPSMPRSRHAACPRVSFRWCRAATAPSDRPSCSIR